MNTIKGMIEDLNNKNTHICGCTTAGELIIALERLQMLEEQQPCDDCISREEAIRIAEQGQIQGYEWQFKKLCTLPSVTPKYTDEEIQKIQELEQAQLDKAYELGKTDSFEEWLASFNTESATCCFTAVQELKNRLEVDNNGNT